MFSQQFCLLRTLLVKQGYLFPLDVKFILNELGDGGVLAVWSQGEQQCANGFLPYRRTQVFDGIPFDLNQMEVAFMRGMKIIPLIVQHVHGR
uniref:Uncharacterized protein n=1 Tax=Hyaloperonospora arabidopsidis (strain Emoy2) TaxID=559515 RepID=M4B189_HYAAE